VWPVSSVLGNLYSLLPHMLEARLYHGSKH
jgi:hypothetical protein